MDTIYSVMEWLIKEKIKVIYLMIRYKELLKH